MKIQLGIVESSSTRTHVHQ